jgi:hypothetical protein
MTARQEEAARWAQARRVKQPLSIFPELPTPPPAAPAPFTFPPMSELERMRELMFGKEDDGLVMKLSARQIFDIMRHAGFPNTIGPDGVHTIAETMTAIALRESDGDPAAYNGNTKTGDRSYGLLQINCLELGARALPLFGITDEKQLLDPNVNAHAGSVLWGRNNRNLDLCWYINRPGYMERYKAHLPAAVAAAKESPLGPRFSPVQGVRVS